MNLVIECEDCRTVVPAKTFADAREIAREHRGCEQAAESGEGPLEEWV